MEHKKPFWAWVFCDSDGTPSSSRVFTGIALGFACGWITALVRHNHAFPDFMGVIAFISALYGINAAKGVLNKSNNQGQ